MKSAEFDGLATPVETLLSRGFKAIGLIACIFNENNELLLFQEKNNKNSLKNSGEWGIPAETCKYGERLRDTVARVFIEEFHVNSLDGVVFKQGGYFETNFIDAVGLARVIVLNCDSQVFRPAPELSTSSEISENEIMSSKWLCLEDALKLKLRRGMPEIIHDLANRKPDLYEVKLVSPLATLLSGAIIHSLAADIVPTR